MGPKSSHFDIYVSKYDLHAFASTENMVPQTLASHLDIYISSVQIHIFASTENSTANNIVTFVYQLLAYQRWLPSDQERALEVTIFSGSAKLTWALYCLVINHEK